MTYDVQEDFPFTVTHAKALMEGSKVDRVVLETDAVERGKITSKPRYEESFTEIENGVEKETTEETMYDLDELPDNVLQVLKKGREMEELECRATVTRKEDENGVIYFIAKWHVDTLEARLLQDNGGEE